MYKQDGFQLDVYEILNATLDCIGKLDALASLRYVKYFILDILKGWMTTGCV